MSAIAVENLSKRYVISHATRHDTLRDTIVHGVKRGARRLLGRQSLAGQSEEFWALQDVSFTVEPGEVVGIIGRNGAGKSTLLKILSRITEPTTGRVRLSGRVASLLEVGTGFHPELTGRENIFLNGAILGMRRAEIRAKFDEIVAFAEVEKFVDTPVKRYSSGMYVRLAFAVAAHLEPEILIVDEVLAVGDAEFQAKCLGKMKSVASESGRTVLFVSHNITAIQHLCSRGVYLRGGKLEYFGDITQAIQRYAQPASPPTPTAQSWTYRCENRWFRSKEIALFTDGKRSTTVLSGQSCTFQLEYNCDDPERFHSGLAVSIMLKSGGKKLVNLWSEFFPSLQIKAGTSGFIRCTIPAWPFREAIFETDIFIHSKKSTIEWIEGCLTFKSHDGDFYGAGRIPNPDQGSIFLPHTWSHSDHPA